MEDLNPDTFTTSELHQEGSEGVSATIGELRVHTGRCLSLLLALGYIKRIRQNVYTVTDVGRALDYSEEISALAPSPKLT